MLTKLKPKEIECSVTFKRFCPSWSSFLLGIALAPDKCAEFCVAGSCSLSNSLMSEEDEDVSDSVVDWASPEEPLWKDSKHFLNCLNHFFTLIIKQFWQREQTHQKKVRTLVLLVTVALIFAMKSFVQLCQAFHREVARRRWDRSSRFHCAGGPGLQKKLNQVFFCFHTEANFKKNYSNCNCSKNELARISALNCEFPRKRFWERHQNKGRHFKMTAREERSTWCIKVTCHFGVFIRSSIIHTIVTTVDNILHFKPMVIFGFWLKNFRFHGWTKLEAQ